METFDQNYAEFISTIQQENPAIIDEFEGIATNIGDIRNFYIVPLETYKKLHILEWPGNLLEDYEECSLVIYLSPILGRHVRGIVRLVHPDRSCVMFAMDYGILDTNVVRSNIFSIMQHAENIPGLAHLCELNMCYPRGTPDYTPESQQSFKFFMGTSREVLNITVKERYNHKLGVLVMSSMTNPDTVSEALAYCHHTQFFAMRL